MSETNEYNKGISRRDALKRMGMLEETHHLLFYGYGQ